MNVIFYSETVKYVYKYGFVILRKNLLICDINILDKISNLRLT